MQQVIIMEIVTCYDQKLYLDLIGLSAFYIYWTLVVYVNNYLYKMCKLTDTTSSQIKGKFFRYVTVTNTFLRIHIFIIVILMIVYRTLKSS